MADHTRPPSQPPDSGSESYRLERLERCDGIVADVVYTAHQAQFDATRAEHPSFQGMHRSEFDGVVASDGAFVLVVWQGDDIAGHAVVCRDLDAMWWVSPPYFEKYFPQETQSSRLFFVVALGTRDGAPPAVLNALIDGLSLEVSEVEGTVIADFAGETSDRFARYIAARSHIHTDITWRRLGWQSYHSFTTSSPRSVALDFRTAMKSQVAPT